ncbi:MAG: hypothetical protein ACOZBH_04965 [Patescibacteria group bacterium]
MPNVRDSVKTRPEYSSEEITNLMDSTAAQAIAAHDVSICEELPIETTYYFCEDEKCEYHPKIIWEDDSITNIYPRTDCLIKYYQNTNDKVACESLYKISDIDGTYCSTYMAEVYSDTNFCAKIPYNSLNIKCEALANLDVTKCYQIQTDESDHSKYSRSVKFCISDIVLRTKNQTSCLKINSADYGDGWERERNVCIWNAMYDKQTGKTSRWLCDDMVDEPDTAGESMKEQCINKEPSAYTSKIPERVSQPTQ